MIIPNMIIGLRNSFEIASRKKKKKRKNPNVIDSKITYHFFLAIFH